MPAETPDPAAEPAQAVPEELRRLATMSDSERIKFCHRRKKGQTLEKKGSSVQESAPVEEGSPPLQAGGEVTRPESIYRRAPRFQQTSRPQETVELEAIIDEAGCVRDARVIGRLSKAHAAAALEAVRFWVFRPAMRGGQPVPVYYSLTMNTRY